MTRLNFTGTGSRILLPPLSLSRRMIPLQKIALNSNGEVNYQELARRLWSNIKYAVTVACIVETEYSLYTYLFLVEVKTSIYFRSPL